tara:strand:- start:2182 stop:2334 length:153 start_codon:yes stop_codon:yes gene_type:complete
MGSTAFIARQRSIAFIWLSSEVCRLALNAAIGERLDDDGILPNAKVAARL